MNITLQDSLKTHRDGQYGLVPPSETVENARRALGRLDIDKNLDVRRIDDVDRLGIPVFIAESENTTEPWIINLSWGKGTTAPLAQASALMEMIERTSAARFLAGDGDPLIRSYNELGDNRPSLHNFKSLLPEHERKPGTISLFRRMPLVWSDSYSLTDGEDVLFPLHYNTVTWSGFAAGNSLEEAIIQGLCEVVERHVIAKIVERRLTIPLIDISTIDDPISRELIRKYENAGIQLHLKDFSQNMGLPSVGLIAYDAEASFDGVRFVCAVGTALSREYALQRALSEVAQHRSQFIYQYQSKGCPEKVDRFPSTWGFPDFRDISDARWLIDGAGEPTCFTDMDTYSNVNYKTEVEVAVRQLEKNGFDVYVTDVTCEVLGIPVVRVSVPASTEPGPKPGQENDFVLDSKTEVYKIHYSKIARSEEDRRIIARLFIETMPENADGYMMLGRCFESQGEYEKALEQYQRAKETGYLRPKINIRLVYCQQQLEKGESAAKDQE